MINRIMRHEFWFNLLLECQHIRSVPRGIVAFANPHHQVIHRCTLLTGRSNCQSSFDEAASSCKSVGSSRTLHLKRVNQIIAPYDCLISTLGCISQQYILKLVFVLTLTFFVLAYISISIMYQIGYVVLEFV